MMHFAPLPCPLSLPPSSSDGLLVARYHKYNLYFEAAFDAPPQPEVVTFQTPFAGRFGLITCFDVLFREPALLLLEKVENHFLQVLLTSNFSQHASLPACSQGVRQIILPLAWMNQLPLLDTIQFQRAFSLGANVTLLAANIRNERLIMTGSGIYTPSSAAYHHAQRGEPEEGRLLVARVPVLDPGWLGQSPDLVETPGFCSSETCFGSTTSRPPASPVFISSMMYDPFTFALLSPTDGEVRVCNGTFCCSLQYRWLTETSGTELYALGAFAGTHTVNGRYAVQVGRTSSDPHPRPGA